MIKYGYVNKEGYLVSRILEDQKEFYKNDKDELCERIITAEQQIETLSSDGWKPVQEIDETQMVCQENESVHPSPYDAGDHIAYRYDKSLDMKGIMCKIVALKQGLEKTDYRVIKCNEYALIGMPLPYDIQALHKEKEDIRIEIRRLQALVQT
ncbi:MAG: hypothetical protein AB2L20_11990 [Mangrovibacterium sp.]